MKKNKTLLENNLLQFSFKKWVDSEKCFHAIGHEDPFSKYSGFLESLFEMISYAMTAMMVSVLLLLAFGCSPLVALQGKTKLP